MATWWLKNHTSSQRIRLLGSDQSIESSEVITKHGPSTTKTKDDQKAVKTKNFDAKVVKSGATDATTEILKNGVVKVSSGTDDEIMIPNGPEQPILDDFPWSVHCGKRRKFQVAYYERYPWLSYSAKKNEAICYPCKYYNTTSNYGFRWRNWTKLRRVKVHETVRRIGGLGSWKVDYNLSILFVCWPDILVFLGKLGVLIAAEQTKRA